MEKRNVMKIVLCGLLFLSSTCFADVIYLKNGGTVKGKIFEEDDVQVKIMVGRNPKVHFRHKIKKIVRDFEKKEIMVEGYNVGDAMGVDGLSDDERELIARFLEAFDSRENMQMMFERIINGVPPEAQEQLREVLDAGEVVKRIIPVYAKYYTQSEMQEVIHFYRSPAGMKHLDLTPIIVEETMKIATEYFQESLATKKALVPPAQ